MKAAKDLLKDYCTSIVLAEGVRLDLFTPSMFRFRTSTLEGEKFPEEYEIPFAMGKLEKWPPVAYRHWTEKNDFVETDVLRIRVSRNYSEGKQFMVWTKCGGKRIHPPDASTSGGLFRDGYAIFDAASAFNEENKNSRYAHWFYNPETDRYDTFLAEDAIMDQYFIYGPEYEKLFAQFNELVGPEPLLPKKAYGFFQTQHLECRGSQEKLLWLAEKLRQRHIPCDTLIVDYEWGDGCDGDKKVSWGSRTTWSSNYTKPLSPQEMIATLKAKHFNLMIIHHSVPGFPNRTAQGWTGKVWDEDVWWKELKAKLDIGLAGTWQDTRRNDVTDSVIWLGIKKYLGNRRVLFMGCRDMWETCGWGGMYKVIPTDQIIGSRRYPFDWTGDADSTWEELKWQIQAITNTQGSMKAVTYITNDSSAKDWKIHVRWKQFITFNSIARSHTQKPWHRRALRDHGLDAALETSIPDDQESMASEANIRKYLKLRYRLIPYIYTYAHVNYETGLPLCRPMLMAFPDDHNCNCDQWPYQYMFGNEFLVAPVYADVASMDIYLPRRSQWIDYWDKTKYEGGQKIAYDTSDMEKMPLFVRSGAIIPMCEESEWVEPSEPYDPLTLDIYPAGTSSFTLYEDDGVSFDFQKGFFASTKIECTKALPNDLTVTVGKTEGKYRGKPSSRTYMLRLNMPGLTSKSFLRNGKAIPQFSEHDEFEQASEGWLQKTPAEVYIKYRTSTTKANKIQTCGS